MRKVKAEVIHNKDSKNSAGNGLDNSKTNAHVKALELQKIRAFQVHFGR